MKEIKAVDYIIANQLGYLAGNVVALITEWQITRNITGAREVYGGQVGERLR